MLYIFKNVLFSNQINLDLSKTEIYVRYFSSSDYNSIYSIKIMDNWVYKVYKGKIKYLSVKSESIW